MNKKWMVIPFVIVAVILSACAPTSVQRLQATDVWARPGLAGGNSAVFFIIENPGKEDVLLSASSMVADAVEMHRTSMQAGVAKMDQQMSVLIPKGKTEFKPGDLHVMLIGLKKDLAVGDTFDVTLDFEKAGEQTITVTTLAP